LEVSSNASLFLFCSSGHTGNESRTGRPITGNDLPGNSRRTIGVKSRKTGEPCRFHITIFILLASLALAIFGCDRGQAGVGKYLKGKNSQNVTELKSDGTFVVREGDVSFTGKYTIEGNRLTLTLTNGTVLTGSIEGRTITDNEGKQWTRP
jgi:hypothetical protein